MRETDRRDFLKLMGLGGVVFASALRGTALAAGHGKDDFYFVQLSDTHWGFDGPSVNPDSQGSLKKAVAAVNALEEQPDFVVFTGDLTHTTDDAGKRRDRMAGFRDIASGLRAKTVRFLPGEHDASLDQGDEYQRAFGDTHYAFEHKGIRFVALDNVSDPTGSVGAAQIAWLRGQVAATSPKTPLVVLTHRPLFDLYPDWDWATRDGAAVIDALAAHPNVTVFYGHIHQEHHHMTGRIAHHAARSLMFPLPAPGSVPKKAPIPWDAQQPYKGLGFRSVEADRRAGRYQIAERPLGEKA